MVPKDWCLLLDHDCNSPFRFHSGHGITDIHSQHQLNIFKGQASGLWDEQSNEKEFEG
jgi:hypothetical protein